MSKNIPHTSFKRKFKSRRKIQQSFFRWLRINQHLFRIPLQIEQRSDKLVEASFIGIISTISATLTWEINVAVMHDQNCWDLLASFDALPIKTPGASSYYCDICNPNDRKHFLSREEIWEAEIFVPFLEWVNNNLAVNTHIELQRVNSTTSARLCKVDDENQCDSFCRLKVHNDTHLMTFNLRKYNGNEAYLST